VPQKDIEIHNAAEVNFEQKLQFHSTQIVFLNSTERLKQEKDQ